jgi:hypothetical protein
MWGGFSQHLLVYLLNMSKLVKAGACTQTFSLLLSLISQYLMAVNGLSAF